MSDAAALTKAFSGARAAYLMLPPVTSREDQERQSDAIAKAVKESGLRYAVHLSSYGAHVPEGTGPIAGLHSSEQKLNAIRGLNVLHLRAAYFMENNLAAIGMIHGMGMLRRCAATRPEAAHDRDARHRRLRRAAPPGPGFFRQTNARAAWRARPVDGGSYRGDWRGIGKPDLRYEQFPYDQVQQVLTQMGIPPKTAAVYIEMYKAINAGVVAPQEPRSPENSTPTSFEEFVQDVFAPAYHGKASTA